MKAGMKKCDVLKLVEKICNEECTKWGTCPISKMMLKNAIALFANYKPKAD